MRILHVLDHSLPHHSGYAFRTASILREQRALGLETYHLTGPKQGESKAAIETVDGWEFHRTAASNGLLSGLPALGEVELMGDLTYRLEVVVKKIRPHILHAHSPVLNALPALRVGRRLNLPVVYEVRAFWEDAAVNHGTAKEGGTRYRLTRWLETFALKRADAITTICEGLRKDIAARGVAEDKITVIPNAVDTDKFTATSAPDAALAQSLGLNGAVVLGFIGSFYAYEGLTLLLDALPKILKTVPNVRVLLVGGGPDEATLKARVRALNIAEQVIFTGNVPHKEVGRYYDLVDVLVYPRVPIRLTEIVTPLKPLEAMAQGRLLVASDVGGHRELIRDGVTGLLFRAGDADHLAQRVIELVHSPQGWPKFKANARRFVEQERTWRSSVSRYLPIYEALAKKRAASSQRGLVSQ